MLTAVLPAERLATAVDAAATFDEECHLTITDDGITFRGTNETREGWVRVEVSKAAFEDFDLDGDRIDATINLENFQRFQRLAAGTDTVQFDFDDDAGRAALRANNVSYSFPPIVSKYVPGIPARHPPQRPVAIRFPGDALHVPVRLAEPLTARIAIEDRQDGNILSITAHGDDDSLEYTIHQETTEGGQIPSVEAVLALDNVTSIYDTIPNEARVRMALGEKGPIVAQFSFADGEGLARYRLEQVA
ncbi:hypothetical protein [Salinarchaeum laminariae]|uniref:hypothetical protein n=1 Tax=Salinarchaeum laminariae TaxID=869888 RepID=UPI0020BE025B|nr:hypothetical protein [Salinarchaeum laminariae]